MFKKSVVIKATRFKPNNNYKFDYKTIIFFTIFLCGLIVGIIIFKRSGDAFAQFITNVLKNYLTVCTSNSIFKNFCSIFFSLCLVVFLLFIFGLCAVGQPLIWICGFLFGCSIGIVISTYYCTFGILGVGYCALINIPCYAITAATLIKCCCESMCISNNIFFYSMGNYKTSNSKNYILKEYVLKYLIFLTPILVASLLKACFLKLFSGLFGLVG